MITFREFYFFINNVMVAIRDGFIPSIKGILDIAINISILGVSWNLSVFGVLFGAGMLIVLTYHIVKFIIPVS